MTTTRRKTMRLRLCRMSQRVRRAQTALDAIADAVLVVDAPRLRVVVANEAACLSLGYCQRELRALKLADIAPQAAHGPLAAALRRLLEQQLPSARLVTVCRHKQGTTFLVEASVRAAVHAGETSLVLVARPLSSDRAACPENPSPSFRDELTGLATRGWLESCLELALDRAQREEYTFGVLFVDVDDLKKINDTWGHLAGDEAMRGVAKHLAASVRPTDLVARYGGDEFGVLLQGIREESELACIAQRLCQVIQVSPGPNARETGKADLTVSVSVGAAVGDRDCGSVWELIHRADQAMYLAKSQGDKGRWVLDTPTAPP